MDLDPLFDLRVGHVLDKLRELPDQSVHTVVTSPPYFGLRSYETEPQVWDGDPGHEHVWALAESRRTQGNRQDPALKSTLGIKAGVPTMSKDTINEQLDRQIASIESSFCECGAWLGHLGLEPTPALFVEHLVSVFREVRRVLRADGSVWLNIGDTYAGGGGFAPNAPVNRRRAEMLDSGVHSDRGFTLGGNHNYEPRVAPTGARVPPGFKPKDLILVSAMLALALQADGWWLRSDNIWRKMGGMPESVFDRTSRSHEHIFHLTKSQHYFYDTDAVREPYSPDNRKVTTVKAGPGSIQHRDGERWPHPDGKIKRSVWDMPTADYPGAHFAVFPEELPDVCIKATTSERGCCPTCGAQWKRKVEAEGETTVQRQERLTEEQQALVISPRYDGGAMQQGLHVSTYGERRTVGWEPTCKCKEQGPVPSTVLDPFVGSGTTMIVARRLGRASIGVELSEKYALAETIPRLTIWFKDAYRPRAADGNQLSLLAGE